MFKKREEAVVLKLEGGLGNQLYEYAAGFLLAARLGINLELDQYIIPLSTVHGEKGSTLNEFILPTLPNSKETFFHPNIPSTFVIKALSCSFNAKRMVIAMRLKIKICRGPDLYIEESLSSLLEVNSARRVHGNFQSWRYVDEAVKYGFLESLQLKLPPSWIVEKLKEIDMENAVAVHFRVGTDAKGNTLDSQPSLHYYKNSLKMLGAFGKNIYVFSDDIALAKQEFGSILGNECNYIEPPLNASAPEKMFFMSSFSKLICANSTFCTWAGWSIINNGGQVCVPQPYSDFSTNHGSRDFSKKWTILDKITGALIN